MRFSFSCLAFYSAGLVVSALQHVHAASPVITSGVTAVAAGDGFTAYLEANGSLYTAGSNQSGQLGDGSTTTRSTFAFVTSDVSVIACGANYILFVKKNGSLWGIGDNYFGQFGDGSTAGSLEPKQILASGVANVSAGASHSLILKTDGSLWSVGLNITGQLGNGSTVDLSAPFRVADSSVVSASAGDGHSLFVKADGSLWGMGSSWAGALGTGTENDVYYDENGTAFTRGLTPIKIVPSGVASASAGANHSFFVKTDGSLWGMGYNSSGQLGDASTTNRLTAVQVLPSGVSSVYAGGEYTMILKRDTSLWSMGSNSYGQLGDGSTTNRNQPVSIASSGVTLVAAGNEHSIYAVNFDLLKAMGRNDKGGYGNGSTDSNSTPVTVLTGELMVTMSEDGAPNAWSAPSLVATDADGDTLTWGVTSQPSYGYASVMGTGPSPSTFDYVPDGNFSGTDSFVVQVSDGVATDTLRINVVVEAVSDSPVIEQGGSVSVTMSQGGSPVSWVAPTLTAVDAEGDFLTWFFQGFTSADPVDLNGTVSLEGNGTSPSTFTYVPSAGFAGTDSFEIGVTDGTDSTLITVNVSILAVNAPPIIAQGDEVSIISNEGQTLSIADLPTLSASDPEGGNLTWSLSSPALNGVATLGGTGSSPTAFAYAPTAYFYGTDSFVIIVSDGDLNDTVTVNLDISGVNDAPVVTQGTEVSVTMSENGSPVIWSAPLLTATDPDGDSVVWSLLSPPLKGSATVRGSGESPSTFTYVPNENYSGTDSFTVRASDGTDSSEVEVSVIIEHVNVPPVIDQGESVSATMSEDGVPSGWFAPSLSATDSDSSNVLTWSVTTSPSNGAASVSGTGASPAVLSYTPTANFWGTDSFIVQVDDGNASDAITINVLVEPLNDSPEMSEEGPISVSMTENGVPVSWHAPPLSASDVEGDDLSWTIFAQPLHGIAEVSGTGVTPYEFIYTPATDFVGSDSFVVYVSDGNSSDQVTINVSILGVNYPPVLSANFSLSTSISEDGFPVGWVAPDLTASDPDPEDSLTWSVTNLPAHGTATVSGNGTSPSQFLFEPETNYFGSDSFTISVTDGLLTDEVSVNVSILPIQDPPRIVQGDSMLVHVSEDEAPVPWITPILTVVDVDSTDILTWSLLTPPTDGIASVWGTGASPTTFAYSPNSNWSGSDSFVVGVSDGTTTDSITVNVIVTPINDAPIIAQGISSSVSMSEEGTPIAWTAPELSATDEEGEELSWGISQQPSHGVALVQGVGVVPTIFQYEPEINFAGDDSFVVSVTDGNSSSFFTVNVNVVNVNDPLSIDQGQSIAFTMSEDGFPVSGVAPVLTVSDFDVADVYTWKASTSPAHGSVEISGNSKELTQLTYVPEASWSGIDSFVVEVSDGTTTDSISVQVTVVPVNDGPVISQGDFVTVFMSEDGSPVPWQTPEFTAFDEEGDPLAWKVLTQPSHGVASLAELLPGSSRVVYDPEPNFAGEDSFVVSVTDGNNSDSITVNVIVANVNALPIINQGESIDVTMSEDGSPVAWNAPVLTVSDADAGGVLSWSILAAPSFGVASIGGRGRSPSYFSYAPTTSWSGIDSFWVQVSDGTATDSITVRVVVTPVNDAPDIAQGDQVTVYMSEDGSPVSWATPKFSASDADGDELSWKVLSQPSHGVAVLANALNPVGLEYEPLSGFSGEDSFVLSVTDGNSSDSITVNVIVTNGNIPPRINQGESVVVVMSEDEFPISWSPPKLSGTDLNGDVLSWSLLKAPSHGLADVSGQGEPPSSFTYKPNLNYYGTDSFAVQVSDGNLTDQIRVDVTLLEVSDLPSSFAFLQPSPLYENSPVGTIAGTFDANEVIGNSDFFFSFSPEANSEDSSNALFLIEANGTLKTKKPLDFEVNPNPYISIRMSNAIGEKIDQTFSVFLSDVFLPIVNTSTPSYITSSSATLHGKVEDSGDDPEGVTGRGFVLGSKPDPSRGGIGVLELPAGVGVGDFAHAAEGLSAGTVYYFRSYATNSEGSRYGPQRRFVTAKRESIGYLVDAAGKTSGWLHSDWFGDFYVTGSDWIYHADFGWLFVFGDSSENLWLWQQDLGWVWVSDVSFPYFYSSKLSNWLLWKQTTGSVSVFFDFSQSNWISHPLVASP
ncbi:MAG: tandem-95 repeat protein [Opitutae bacterium]|nr:tandem-95 repeat protein [Opitutae bacterium]